MKVLYITRLFPHLEHQSEGIFNLFRVHALYQSNVEVEVLLFNSVVSRFKKRIKTLNDYNLKDLNLPFTKELDIPVKVINYLHIPKLYPQYLSYWTKKVAQESHCDLVHFHFLWDVFGDKTLKKERIPYVITCHGSDIHRLPMAPQKAQDQACQILHRASHVIFVSKHLKNTAQECGYNGQNGSVITNGIHPDIFYPNPSKKQTFRIGFVGHLIPIKRVDHLPQIFEIIKQKIPQATLHIVGDGPLKENMRLDFELRNIVSSVTFTGLLDSQGVAQELRKMDILVLPSLREGLGCVVLEAQACGVSVIGTENGGIPEIIDETGIIVPEGKEFDRRFSQAVIDVLMRPKEARSSTKNPDTFHWKSIIEKEKKIYQAVLSKD